MKSTARANAWPDADRCELAQGAVVCRKLIRAVAIRRRCLILQALDLRAQDLLTCSRRVPSFNPAKRIRLSVRPLYDWPRSRSSPCRI